MKIEIRWKGEGDIPDYLRPLTDQFPGWIRGWFEEFPVPGMSRIILVWIGGSDGKCMDSEVKRDECQTVVRVFSDAFVENIGELFDTIIHEMFHVLLGSMRCSHMTLLQHALPDGPAKIIMGEEFDANNEIAVRLLTAQYVRTHIVEALAESTVNGSSWAQILPVPGPASDPAPA